MCVEMEVTEPLPEKIWIEKPRGEGFWQKLQYPGFKYCAYCSMIGHVEACRRRIYYSNRRRGNDKQPKTNEREGKEKQQNTSSSKNTQVYKPVAGKEIHKGHIGTSGAKNSKGEELKSTTNTSDEGSSLHAEKQVAENKMDSNINEEVALKNLINKNPFNALVLEGEEDTEVNSGDNRNSVHEKASMDVVKDSLNQEEVQSRNYRDDQALSAEIKDPAVNEKSQSDDNKEEEDKGNSSSEDHNIQCGITTVNVPFEDSSINSQINPGDGEIPAIDSAKLEAPFEKDEDVKSLSDEEDQKEDRNGSYVERGSPYYVMVKRKRKARIQKKRS